MEYTNLPNFYTHTVSYSQNPVLAVEQIGRDVSTPGFSYPHYNNTYVIYVVRKGKGILETDGKKYLLKQNDAFLTKPDSLSIQTADSDTPWELCFISFSGTVAKELIEKTVFKGGTTTVSLKNRDFANEIIRSTIRLNETFHNDFVLLECFFRMLSYLDSQKVFSVKKVEDNQNKYVAEIKRYIHSTYPDPIKISEIAESLSINRSHLYRIFKKETGIGVEDYIINIRMDHAKLLLKDTSLSVATVASLAGYKNYTTFFKRFKLATGVTPIEYRQRESDNTTAASKP